MTQDIQTGDIVSWMGDDRNNGCERRRYGRVKEVHQYSNGDETKLRVESGEVFLVSPESESFEIVQQTYVEVED